MADPSNSHVEDALPETTSTVKEEKKDVEDALPATTSTIKEEKKDDESKEVKKDDESKVVKKDDESKEVKKDDESKEVKKDDESNEVKKVDESKVEKKDDESKEVKKDDESKEAKKDDESKEVKKDDESKEVKKVDESKDEKKVDESNEVKKVDESKEVKKDDKSKDEKKDDESKDEKASQASLVSFLQLFRYATPLDKLMMFVGSIGAIGCGSAMPIMIVLFSQMIQAFLDFTATESRGGNLDLAASVLKTRITHLVLLVLVLAFSVFALAYIQTFLWMAAGERQAKRVRKLYYAAILRQDIAYFDNMSTGDITNRITSDSDLYQEGISEKVGAIFQHYATFIAGFTIAFTTGWKLALVVCCMFPFLALAVSVSSRLITSSAKQGQDAYGEAGAIVEQALSGIRTVIAYGGENHEIKRYAEKLQKAYVIGKKKALIDGLAAGSGMFILYSGYALTFWYGSILIVKGEATGGEIYNIFFAILIGALSIGNSTPSFLAISNARGAASNLFSVIDRVPSINSASTDGKKLDKAAVNGRIEFRNVKFHYPTRPDVQVLKNFSLTIEPGETVALVGSSGGGKSTIINLLERFYDPIEGQVLLDGEDIKNINIKSLRTQIGLVSQEPTLFPTSIQQNVAWGFNSEIPEPSLDKVIEACKKSNAHDFINKLPQKYGTDVGENGSLMSGGQKQRIAIARALIKNPAILLLDEATSALDTESERLVQEALDFAATERTTIVIAHRLSTIKNADKIVVMSHGDILEVGRHDELIASKGVYYGLVQAQGLKSEKDEKDEDAEVSEIPESNGDETKIILDEKEHKDYLMKRVETKTSTVQSEIDKELMEKRSKQSTPFARVFKLQKPELPYIIVGTLGAIVSGLGFPIFSFAFSAILDVFAKIDKPQELRRDANFLSGMFFVFAVTTFVAFLVQRSFFALSAERLSKRLRIMVFTHLLKQEIGFFDEDKNSVGALTLQLSIDATKVDGLTGSLMSSIVQSITSFVAGLTIAFIYGWKLTLVILAVAPLLFINGFLQTKAIAGYGAKTRKAYEETYQIVHQSVANMRTIASLTREETFKKLYRESIKYPHTVAINGSIVSALGFGISHGILYLVQALAIWYGGQLVATQEYTQKQMTNVFFAVVYCAIGAGQASSFAPDVAKAKNAAISIFELLDRKSQIDPTDNEGKDRPTPVSGSGKLHDVHFNYPIRPDIKVLNGLGLTIDSDKTIALVGESGSGKSTVISLFLRYYDALSGEVNLEKINVKNWNLEYLRANIGTVSQEPVLFDLTIGESIAYGKGGCSQEEIEAAAKDANIHDFIIGLPQGYDTPVGERGTQLSGGQKQRIAIARALIRQPKLLLLDEATSALDSESEKIVQDALDKAAKGRTTITVAHRLSTIQDADLICVMKKGEIVEQGQHFELIKKRGYYYDLVNKQTLI